MRKFPKFRVYQDLAGVVRKTELIHEGGVLDISGWTSDLRVNAPVHERAKIRITFVAAGIEFVSQHYDWPVTK